MPRSHPGGRGRTGGRSGQPTLDDGMGNAGLPGHRTEAYRRTGVNLPQARPGPPSNDLIALWREEGKRLPGFRLNKWERRPTVNALKFENHSWMTTLSQTAVKGGLMACRGSRKIEGPGVNPGPGCWLQWSWVGPPIIAFGLWSLGGSHQGCTYRD